MKKYLYISCLSALLIAACRPAKAQIIDANYYLDAQGKPFRNNSGNYNVDDIEGSMFFYDKWSVGDVTNADGTVLKNVRLKYSVYGDQLIFAGANGEMMALDKPSKRFTLNTVVFASGFPAVDNFTADSYYQVIEDGKTKLLKHTSKTVIEIKGGYSTTSKVTRQFTTTEAWYILKNGSMIKVKPDKKSVLAALNDKATDIDTYLASHKVNFKNDTELAGLLNHYNSLQ